MNSFLKLTRRYLPLNFTLLFLSMMLLSVNCFAQEYEVKGRVVDSNDKAVAGVNVLIKGTPNGTATNAEGNFNMVVPYGESTFMFHFVGYKSIEQKMELDENNNYEVKVILVADKIKYRKHKSSVELIKHFLKPVY